MYGNRYTYAHLGDVSKVYPVPKRDADASDNKRSATALAANAADPKPDAPASAGRQFDSSDTQKAKDRGGDVPADKTEASAPVKERLFAHPDMPGSREAGGLEQQLDSQMRSSGKYETFKAYFSRPFGLDPSKVRLRPLKKGSHVIGGTILGRVGRTVPGMASHLNFAIRPAGRGAPNIDPKPILDGWKLLEATAIYRASGRNVLYGKDGVGAMSIGQILLLPKPLLEKRVLSDERIDIYEGGRDDIRSGQIDRRVLATLEYLAESGLSPTVSCLKSGHGFYTSSGNVSEHSSGNAVDISMINGIPILGHQEPGGITEQTVRRLMQLQGTMQPHQIISLLEMGGVDVRDGGPQRPHPRGLPADVRREQEARQAGARGARAGPVVRPHLPPRRDREPGGADQAVQVRAAGQEEALEQRPPGRVRRAPKAPSASFSSSSGSFSVPRTAAIS